MRYWFAVRYDENHRWLPGNHDDPAVCAKHRNCLTGWGYNPKMDMFWISGGYSIDAAYRIIGIDWWEDEEIAWEELQKAVEMFGDVKPRVVVSHECPATAQYEMFPHTTKRHVQNRTKMAIEEMFRRHQPEFWCFGHYHYPTRKQIGSTFFVCCGEVLAGRNLDCQIEQATFEVPGLKWA